MPTIRLNHPAMTKTKADKDNPLIAENRKAASTLVDKVGFDN